MKHAVIALLLSTITLIAQNWKNTQIHSNFVMAVWTVESGKRVGNLPGDYVNGVPRSKGPLQIHISAFKDSGIKGDYARCSELEFSIKVMQGYLLRYEKNAVKSNDFNSLARCWNGGPSWRKNRANTDNYWQKIKSALDR